jgi:hypothetical protein
MNQELIDRFYEAKPELRELLSRHHPSDYEELVRWVIKAISEELSGPDHENIQQTRSGGYSGTLLFTIADKSDGFWYVKIDYGSCSACDTLEGIRGYSDEPPTRGQTDDYMSLALHIVQQLKQI